MGRFLKITLKVLLWLFAFFVVIFILMPTPHDGTPRAKVSMAVLLMSQVRTALDDHCRAGTLEAGMTHVSLGFPEPFQPDPNVKYVRHISVVVESAQRAKMIATLDDINVKIPFVWKARNIPVGAKVVLEGRCKDGGMMFFPHTDTTMPDKYLPDSLRPDRSAGSEGTMSSS